MKRPLVIYLAAPYTASTKEDIIANVVRARRIATHFRQAGAAVIVPHQESIGCEITMTEPEWLCHCLALAERCDVLVRAHGASKGADLECAWIKLLGKPIVQLEHEMSGGDCFGRSFPTVAELRDLVNNFER